jgi:hypothetical protein
MLYFTAMAYRVAAQAALLLRLRKSNYFRAYQIICFYYKVFVWVCMPTDFCYFNAKIFVKDLTIQFEDLYVHASH